MTEVIEQHSNDNVTTEFLLKEYGRLSEHQKSLIDSYHRRFDIYLAAATAAFIGVVTLSQATTSSLQKAGIIVILTALLVLGLNIFASLSYSNVSQVHFERAVRLIQKHFAAKEPSINEFLYFNHNQGEIAGTTFKALVIRGLTGGGPKSILVVVNSSLLAILTIKAATWFGIIYPTVKNQVSIGLIVFLLASILHVIYARWIYKINGI